MSSCLIHVFLRLTKVKAIAVATSADVGMPGPDEYVVLADDRIHEMVMKLDRYLVKIAGPQYVHRDAIRLLAFYATMNGGIALTQKQSSKNIKKFSMFGEIARVLICPCAGCSAVRP